MRTIKFRAWDKKTKTRILNFTDYASIDNDGDLYVTEKADKDGLDIEVVQFTGLLDKNGKEIYEDDLLKVKYSINEGKEGWYVEGIYRVFIDPLEGLRLYYVNIFNPDKENKNQYPANRDLSPHYRTLDTDSRNNHYDRLAVRDSWGENHLSRHTWKANDYSNDIEVIGNIYENPELLKT